MDLSKRTYILSFPFKSVIYKNYVLKTCKNINFKWWHVNIMKNELGFKGYLNKGRLSSFFYNFSHTNDGMMMVRRRQIDGWKL
jgi:hypothetical protein